MKIYLFPVMLFFAVQIDAQCYNISQISYAPDSFNVGAPVALQNDDYWSAATNIGFSFCFYGEQYSKIVVGSNGIISFDTTLAANYCQWPIGLAIPNNSGSPENSIMVSWQDLYPVSTITSWTIKTATYGVSPNRRFVVSYDSVPMYQSTNQYFTGEAILFESSNVIEIHIHHKETNAGWNGGKAIEGIYNQLGTEATVVPGRNSPTQWNATDDSWRFTPICNVCSGVGIASAENLTGNLIYFPDPAKDLLHINYSSPGNSFSVQIADVTGKICFKDENSQLEERDLRIDALAEGIYFLQIIDAKGNILEVRKISKTN